MSRSQFYLSDTSLELSEGLLDAVENNSHPQAVSSPSTSSTSSSSSLHRKRNHSYGVGSESEASMEYPDTPITEEFREVIADSTSQFGVSLAATPESESSSTPQQIHRRSGYYEHKNREENAKLRMERVISAAVHRSLPSPFSSPIDPFPLPPVSDNSSYLDKVVQETVDTEKLYVKDLKDIIRGYFIPFSSAAEIKMHREDLHALFGNIKDIYKFNRKFFENLKKCGHDPVKIGRCFIDQSDGFRVYADYCTNYPRCLEVFSRYNKDPRFFVLLKRLQDDLKHPLPLPTYLFKPVQRILKYHLLLKNIVAYHNESLPGHDVLVEAYSCMMDVADHLNEMKRNQERRAEIQKLLLGSSGMDLSSFGDLILEDKFNLSGVRDVHWAFLFRKGLLLAKKRRDDQLQIKTTIMCSNLTLVESIPKDPLAFQVIPFDSPKTQFTIQARTLEQKKLWCQEIKTLMLDSYNVAIPEKARQLLMHTGKSHHENDHYVETSKSHQISEKLEKRRLRNRSLGFVSGIGGKNQSDTGNGAVGKSPQTGRSSDSLCTETATTKESRSRPLAVNSSVRRQKSERRSQSLDSLHNVLLESELAPDVVKCKSESRRNSKQQELEKSTEQQDLGRTDLKFQMAGGTPGQFREEADTCIDLQEEKSNNITSRKKKVDCERRSSKKKNRSRVLDFTEDEQKSELEDETNEQHFIKSEDPDEGKKPSVLLEKSQEDVSNNPKVTRSALLRASSFRKAVEMHRVDSIAIKRSDIKVRRKKPRDPRDGDRDDDASSDSGSEHIVSKFQIGLPPILGQTSSLPEPNLIDDNEVESSEHSNDVSENEMQPGDYQSPNNNSRCSSFSFLSMTFESLPLSDALTEVTPGSLEGSFNEEQSVPCSPCHSDEHSNILNMASEKVEHNDEEPTVSKPFPHDESNIVNLIPEFDLSELVNLKGTDKFELTSDSKTADDISLKPCNEIHLSIRTSIDANAGLIESPGMNITPMDPVNRNNCIVDVNPISLPKKTMLHKNVEAMAASCMQLKVPVRNSSSLPCLTCQVSEEGVVGTMHQNEMPARSECLTLVHSRKLSSSDLTGYFSDCHASAVADVRMPPFDSSDSVKNQCNRSPAIETSSSDKDEDHAAFGDDIKWEENSRDESVSYRKNISKASIAVGDGANAVTIDAESVSSSSGKIKNKAKPKLYFEKVPNFILSSPDCTNEELDAIPKRLSRSESKNFTRTSSRKPATESIRSTDKELIPGEALSKSCSLVEELSKADPMEEFLNYRHSRFNHKRTYVYRLARAYSSRVKQLQKEAVETNVRRPLLRKWSITDESGSRQKGHCLSLSDKTVGNSSLSSAQPRHSFQLIEKSSDSSLSNRSFSDSSETPIPGAVCRKKSRIMKHGKQFFGLSLDSFPDFCLSKSDDGHSDDCFDEKDCLKEQSLVKQRVKHFEGSQ